MVLLLFALTFGAERRHAVRRGRLQRRRGRAHLSAVRRRAQDAARARHSRILAMGDGGKPAARLLGCAPARRAVVRLSRMPGRHHRRRVARHRAAVRHQHSAAGDLRARHHQVGRDARRHLLRLAIWRLDHVDPDADPGRGRLGHDLHRRLCHGAEGPRGRGPVHRRRRLMDRGHVRRDHADADRAAARHLRAAVRTARIHRAAGARPGVPRLHVVDLAAAHLADGVRSGFCSAPSASTT